MPRNIILIRILNQKGGLVDFPKTYIDCFQNKFADFESNVASLKARLSVDAARSQPLVSTGTTIISILSADQKIGIIVSDGRVTAEMEKIYEDYRKIASCRVGFIGFAGSLGAAQVLFPHFKNSLDGICDSRGVPITASGAARHLYGLYMRLADAGMPIELIPLFWDYEEKKCHLYHLCGMSKIRLPHAALTGSGSRHISLETEEAPPVNTEEELLEQARRQLARATIKDGATNNHLFYGIVNNGEFREGKEVVSCPR